MLSKGSSLTKSSLVTIPVITPSLKPEAVILERAGKLYVMPENRSVVVRGLAGAIEDPPEGPRGTIEDDRHNQYFDYC